MSKEFEPVANHALSVLPSLNSPGFEASKVFALTALYLGKPPPDFPSVGYLRKHLAPLYVFVIHPSHQTVKTRAAWQRNELKNAAADVRSKLQPELWYIHTSKNGVEVGKGRPSRSKMGRKAQPDVVFECSDRELVDMATGKIRAQKLYEKGTLGIRGKLDKALEIGKLLAFERSKLFKVVSTEPKVDKEDQTSYRDDLNGLNFVTSNPTDFRSRL
ncbi:hypothetical protein MVES1_003669 [Malassezia vespertilionis]|uniref:SCP2 domain-containing protein n=1 Tax=Malassezia vespertilionis TaxID=2020962 RepID=A0A2N1J8C8_9BASI|nr:uncharacterized protein MVES1_003669 [Malassezia vespertilionis]PKI82806.1 hypothetical protein MVES_003231 [Malassezia vespertilionis]WFD08297.1 hypothetical protein MVES1_003669 [Malassezia vespertilionis]